METQDLKQSAVKNDSEVAKELWSQPSLEFIIGLLIGNLLPKVMGFLVACFVTFWLVDYCFNLLSNSFGFKLKFDKPVLDYMRSYYNKAKSFMVGVSEE